MAPQDHYGQTIESNSPLEIIDGCNHNRFTVDVKGLRPKRYRILHGDDGELIGGDAFEKKSERPHIAAAVKLALQSINHNGDKGLTDARRN